MVPRFVIAVHHPALREEMRRRLALHGFDVAVAANGLQCIERLQEGLPTVLVLDPHIQWGGGDGVLDWLRLAEPFSKIAVVLVNDGNGDEISSRLRPLIRGYRHFPCGLQEMSDFIDSLEQHARQLGSESPMMPDYVESPS